METHTNWTLDKSHSEILFKVKHLMITNVRGEFRDFDATLITKNDDFANAKVNAIIESTSIFTNNRDRDTHLQGADFFDVENHPKLKFEGTSFEKLDEENYQLKGLLNIKDVTKEVIFDVDFGGVIKDPYGNEKAGFSLSGKIKRTDWGLNWNAALEAGGVMVSEDVRITAEVQFVKQ